MPRSEAWWRRVSAMVDEARDADPAGREDLLARTWPADPEAGIEARAWLVAIESDGSSLLDAPVYEWAPDLVAELAVASPIAVWQPGHRVGPWRLVEEIGSGGSGIVWRAVRADGAYDQTVALKALWGRSRAPELERRFEAERRILASLEHSNIARLIDGGLAHGIPYLVMEHVDGQPITKWCDERTASLEQRLALFLIVCDAVGYAHRHLVVHRDLKPSNILVTADGVPKIVDFGTAKLLDDEARAAMETRVPMWTPAYAAPEQIRGGAVTTATDVWGLGAVLYRLLTGKEARRLDSLTPVALERAAGAEPRRPSGEADPDCTGITARQLTGDLDAIVTTAMRPGPAGRYASAMELAADLRRHATGLPVEAREPTGWYRLQKLVARNRLRVAAAVVLIGLAAAYAITVTVQSDRIVAERDRAQHEAAKAEEAVDFLGELIWAAGPYVGPSIEGPQDLADLAILQADSAFSDTPAIHAKILANLGKSVYWIGALDKARALLQRAVAIHEVEGPDRVDPETGWEALHYLAATLHQQGSYSLAEATYRRSLDLYGPALGSRSEQVAQTLNVLGWLHHETGDLDRAEALYLDALEIWDEVLGPNSAGYSTTLENLGLLHADRGDYDAAELLIREVIETRQRYYGPWHVNTAYALRSLARILARSGRGEEAEALLRTTVEMRRRLLGPEHHKYAEDIATLAAVLAGRGELSQALPLLEEALRIRRESLGENNPVTAVTRHHLATVHHRLGRSAEAEGLYRSALESVAGTYGVEHPWAVAIREDLDRFASRLPPAEREWLSGTRLPLPRKDAVRAPVVLETLPERNP